MQDAFPTMDTLEVTLLLSRIYLKSVTKYWLAVPNYPRMFLCTEFRQGKRKDSRWNGGERWGLLGNIFLTATAKGTDLPSKQTQVPGVAERQTWRFAARFFNNNN